MVQNVWSPVSTTIRFKYDWETVLDLLDGQEQDILNLRQQVTTLTKELSIAQETGAQALVERHTSQPIINVNLDTGAISQALLLGMKVLIEQQTQTISDVIREALESRAITVDNEGEPQVSQKRAIQPVALSQSEPQASGKTRQEIIAELLLENPTISGREIERRTGIPDTTARRILSKLRGE